MSDVPSVAAPSVPTPSVFDNAPAIQPAVSETPEVVAAPPPEVPKSGFDDEIETTIQGQKQKVRLKDLITGYNKYQTGDFRLQEAAKMRQELEAREHRLRSGLEGVKKNPAALLLEALGSQEAVDQFTEDHIWQKIQNSKKPPEQIEAEKYKTLYEQKVEEDTRREKQYEEHQQTQRVNQYRQHYDQLFADALQSGGLPKTPETIERMSKIMQSSLKNGYEPTKQELIEAVESSFTKEIGTVFGKLDAEKILKYLGPELSKKIRDYDLSKLQNPMNQGQRSGFNVQSNQSHPKHEEKMSVVEWKAQNRLKAGL